MVTCGVVSWTLLATTVMEARPATRVWLTKRRPDKVGVPLDDLDMQRLTGGGGHCCPLLLSGLELGM